MAQVRHIKHGGGDVIKHGDGDVIKHGDGDVIKSGDGDVIKHGGDVRRETESEGVVTGKTEPEAVCHRPTGDGDPGHGAGASVPASVPATPAEESYEAKMSKLRELEELLFLGGELSFDELERCDSEGDLYDNLHDNTLATIAEENASDLSGSGSDSGDQSAGRHSSTPWWLRHPRRAPSTDSSGDASATDDDDKDDVGADVGDDDDDDVTPVSSPRREAKHPRLDIGSSSCDADNDSDSDSSDTIKGSPCADSPRGAPRGRHDPPPTDRNPDQGKTEETPACPAPHSGEKTVGSILRLIQDRNQSVAAAVAVSGRDMTRYSLCDISLDLDDQEDLNRTFNAAEESGSESGSDMGTDPDGQPVRRRPRTPRLGGMPREWTMAVDSGDEDVVTDSGSGDVNGVRGLPGDPEGITPRDVPRYHQREANLSEDDNSSPLVLNPPASQPEESLLITGDTSYTIDYNIGFPEKEIVRSKGSGTRDSGRKGLERELSFTKEDNSCVSVTDASSHTEVLVSPLQEEGYTSLEYHAGFPSKELVNYDLISRQQKKDNGMAASRAVDVITTANNRNTSPSELMPTIVAMATGANTEYDRSTDNRRSDHLPIAGAQLRDGGVGVVSNEGEGGDGGGGNLSQGDGLMANNGKSIECGSGQAAAGEAKLAVAAPPPRPTPRRTQTDTGKEARSSPGPDRLEPQQPPPRPPPPSPSLRQQASSPPRRPPPPQQQQPPPRPPPPGRHAGGRPPEAPPLPPSSGLNSKKTHAHGTLSGDNANGYPSCRGGGEEKSVQEREAAVGATPAGKQTSPPSEQASSTPSRGVINQPQRAESPSHELPAQRDPQTTFVPPPESFPALCGDARLFSPREGLGGTHARLEAENTTPRAATQSPVAEHDDSSPGVDTGETVSQNASVSKDKDSGSRRRRDRSLYTFTLTREVRTRAPPSGQGPVIYYKDNRGEGDISPGQKAPGPPTAGGPGGVPSITPVAPLTSPGGGHQSTEGEIKTANKVRYQRRSLVVHHPLPGPVTPGERAAGRSPSPRPAARGAGGAGGGGGGVQSGKGSNGVSPGPPHLSARRRHTHPRHHSAADASSEDTTVRPSGGQPACNTGDSVVTDTPGAGHGRQRCDGLPRNADSVHSRVDDKPVIPTPVTRSISEPPPRGATARYDGGRDEALPRVIAYTPSSGLCTARATSTALAHRSQQASGEAVTEGLRTNSSVDSVLSAIASAEATGTNPYIALARASARSASLATATAIQSATRRQSPSNSIQAGGDSPAVIAQPDADDVTDIRVVISTSCDVRGSVSDVREDAQTVLGSLADDVEVRVETSTEAGRPGGERTLPRPALTDVGTQSSIEYKPNDAEGNQVEAKAVAADTPPDPRQPLPQGLNHVTPANDTPPSGDTNHVTLSKDILPSGDINNVTSSKVTPSIVDVSPLSPRKASPPCVASTPVSPPKAPPPSVASTTVSSLKAPPPSVASPPVSPPKAPPVSPPKAPPPYVASTTVSPPKAPPPSEASTSVSPRKAPPPSEAITPVSPAKDVTPRGDAPDRAVTKHRRKKGLKHNVIPDLSSGYKVGDDGQRVIQADPGILKQQTHPQHMDYSADVSGQINHPQNTVTIADVNDSRGAEILQDISECDPEPIQKETGLAPRHRSAKGVPIRCMEDPGESLHINPTSYTIGRVQVPGATQMSAGVSRTLRNPVSGLSHTEGGEEEGQPGRAGHVTDYVSRPDVIPSHEITHEISEGQQAPEMDYMPSDKPVKKKKKKVKEVPKQTDLNIESAEVMVEPIPDNPETNNLVDGERFVCVTELPDPDDIMVSQHTETAVRKKPKTKKSKKKILDDVMDNLDNIGAMQEATAMVLETDHASGLKQEVEEGERPQEKVKRVKKVKKPKADTSTADIYVESSATPTGEVQTRIIESYVPPQSNFVEDSHAVEHVTEGVIEKKKVKVKKSKKKLEDESAIFLDNVENLVESVDEAAPENRVQEKVKKKKKVKKMKQHVEVETNVETIGTFYPEVIKSHDKMKYPAEGHARDISVTADVDGVPVNSVSAVHYREHSSLPLAEGDGGVHKEDDELPLAAQVAPKKVKVKSKTKVSKRAKQKDGGDVSLDDAQRPTSIMKRRSRGHSHDDTPDSDLIHGTVVKTRQDPEEDITVEHEALSQGHGGDTDPNEGVTRISVRRDHVTKPAAETNRDKREHFMSQQKVSEPVSPEPRTSPRTKPDLTPPQPRRHPDSQQGFILVDIQYEGSPTFQRRNLEALRKQILKARPTPPPAPYAEGVWNAPELIASRSQDRGLDAGASDLDSDFSFRKSKSLTTMPRTLSAGESQCAVETDLDAGEVRRNAGGYVADADSAWIGRYHSMGSIPHRETSAYGDGRLDKPASCDPLLDSSFSEVAEVSAGQSHSLSAHELRISESLSKLDVPSWFRNSQRPNQEIVLLRNARDPDLIYRTYGDSGRSSPATRDPGRDAASRPVVIQHRVSVPVRLRTSPIPMTGRDPDAARYQLPSAKLRQSAVDLRPMPLKAVSGGGVSGGGVSGAEGRAPSPARPAKEAYLQLKARQASRESDLQDVGDDLGQKGATAGVSPGEAPPERPMATSSVIGRGEAATQRATTTPSSGRDGSPGLPPNPAADDVNNPRSNNPDTLDPARDKTAAARGWRGGGGLEGAPPGTARQPLEEDPARGMPGHVRQSRSAEGGNKSRRDRAGRAKRAGAGGGESDGVAPGPCAPREEGVSRPRAGHGASEAGGLPDPTAGVTPSREGSGTGDIGASGSPQHGAGVTQPPYGTAGLGETQPLVSDPSTLAPTPTDATAATATTVRSQRPAKKVKAKKVKKGSSSKHREAVVAEDAPPLPGQGGLGGDLPAVDPGGPPPPAARRRRTQPPDSVVVSRSDPDAVRGTHPMPDSADTVTTITTTQAEAPPRGSPAATPPEGSESSGALGPPTWAPPPPAAEGATQRRPRRRRREGGAPAPGAEPSDFVVPEITEGTPVQSIEAPSHLAAATVTPGRSVRPRTASPHLTDLSTTGGQIPAVRPDPDARPSPVEDPLPDDDGSSGSIGIGVPDPETPAGGGRPLLKTTRLQKTRRSLEDVLDGLLALPVTGDPPSHRRETRQLLGETPGARVTRLLETAARGATAPQSSPDHDRSSSDHDAAAPEADVTRGRTRVHFAESARPGEEVGGGDGMTSFEDDVIVKCRNPRCQLEAPLTAARQGYKTCHNCYTYYCSRECRKAHWERHKRKCGFSRVNSTCKQVIRKIHDEPKVSDDLARIARSGFLSRGRGCVTLLFASQADAETFLKYGMPALEAPAAYMTAEELRPMHAALGESLFEVTDLSRSYNPEQKFVVHVLILVGEAATRASRRDCAVVSKCAKLRLHSTPEKHPGRPPRATSGSGVRDDTDTLILTPVPGSEFTENLDERKAREICFSNIQRKLRQRGTSLRHQYPDVYNQLVAYVEHKTHFTPITIYPIDGATGRTFMCVIMPESEPELAWSSRTDVLNQVGLSTTV